MAEEQKIEFTFTTSKKTRWYFDEVMEVLQKFGEVSKEEAVNLMNRFWKSKDLSNDDKDLTFHETPYYWAMCILHHPVLGDGNIDWERDPAFWPPPFEYLWNAPKKE